MGVGWLVGWGYFSGFFVVVGVFFVRFQAHIRSKSGQNLKQNQTNKINIGCISFLTH